MKNFLCSITILFMFGVIFNDAYKPDDIYNSLSEEGKIHFLRYYLVKGLVDTESRDAVAFQRPNFPDLKIPDNIVYTFEHMQMEPPNFHHKLLEKFMRKYRLSRSVASRALSSNACPPNYYCGRPAERYICVPENQCIDLGDVGSICCT